MQESAACIASPGYFEMCAAEVTDCEGKQK
jgi:hypothetical protein